VHQDREPRHGDLLGRSEPVQPSTPYGLLPVQAIRWLAAKSGDERFLSGGFDSLGAVLGADPGDRIGGGKAGEDGETGQRGSCAAMTAKATDFHLFPSAGTVEKGPERGDHQGRVGGDTEVRPVEVVVGPGRPPPVVEVEPVVGLPVTRVRGDRVERHGSDPGAVGQGDRITVPVRLELAMVVTGVSALGWLSAQEPVHLVFGARHDHTGLSQSQLPNGELDAYGANPRTPA
jgi:hypothetical protein